MAATYPAMQICHICIQRGKPPVRAARGASGRPRRGRIVTVLGGSLNGDRHGAMRRPDDDETDPTLDHHLHSFGTFPRCAFQNITERGLLECSRPFRW